MNLHTFNRTWLPTVGMLVVTLTYASVGSANDWLFAKSDFSHNPRSGERVTQYAAIPPVEALPDPRDVTSRYWSIRTQLRGTNGSNTTVYEVRSFGDKQGNNLAQWERGFDAWKEAATVAGPYWASSYWPGGVSAPGLDYNNGGPNGYGANGYGAAGYGAGYGYGPNYGYGGGTPGVPFGVSPYGYGYPPYGAYPPYYGGHGHHSGHHGGGHHGPHPVPTPVTGT